MFGDLSSHLPGLRSLRWRITVAFLGVLAVLILTSDTLHGGASSGTVVGYGFRRAELAFTGDIIPHRPIVTFARRHARTLAIPNGSFPAPVPPDIYAAPAVREDRHYDFVPAFEEVAEKLRAADLAICHLETTISPLNPRGYPRFRAPSGLVEAIALSGWGGCSVASNHAFDYGREGVTFTIGALERHGLAHTGTAVSAESRRPGHYNINGIRIGHLSYTYGLNDYRLPKREPWWVNLIDVDTIAADSLAARGEGAEFIVVSMHWGTEYQSMPNAYQKRIAHEIAETGAVDLLVGHHAHVLQPVDRIGGMWVAYGLGNFISNQSWGSTQNGAILHVGIGDSPDGLTVREVTYTPTWVDRSVMQVVAVADRLLDPDLDDWRRAALRRSWSATVGALEALGGRDLGIRPAAQCCP